MKEKLTVVIPIYNRADYLIDTLTSTQCLKGHGIALILVDNGSSDTSLSICREFALKNNSDDFKIRVEVEHTPGACAARNKGLDLCDTPYIYFFDSDDLMTPNFGPCVEKLLYADNHLDLIYLPIQQFKGKKGKVKVFVKECNPIPQILNGMFATHCMILRTEFAKQIGGWNESLEIWQDWEFGIRVAKYAQRMQWYTKEVFHHINIHADSITGKNFSERTTRIIKTMETARHSAKGYEEALLLRAVIMEGNLRREGSQEGVALFRAYEEKLTAQLRVWSSIKASLIRLYMRLGLRGAWRLALKLTVR